jgi:ketosteroid isomerase-like protein
MSITDDFSQTVKQLEAAGPHFYTGDAEPFKALWSQTDDVTIFGGWGAYEQGWEQVGPRLDWAAARFRGGQGTIEPLTMGMSGDLAYQVFIERAEVRIAGRDELSPMALRVTHIYRHEEGTWKIIHRHADAITDKTEASAVLQQ